MAQPVGPCPRALARSAGAHRRTRRVSARAGLALLILAGGGGCEELGLQAPRPGATSILDVFRGASPLESAVDATDPYDADKRYRGILALGAAPFGGEPPYVALFADAMRDPDPGVRAAAARALANHGTPDQAPLLIDALDDPDRAVRLESARALQRIHDPAAVLPLLARLDQEREPEVEVRTEAAYALGQYPDNRVFQALVAALGDRNLALNAAALFSLRALTAQDFGFDRRAWLDWHKGQANAFAARGEYTYPVFQRERKLIEYLPFVPGPPNETPARPVGMPPPDDA